MALEYETLKGLDHLKVQINHHPEGGRSNDPPKKWVGLIESDWSVSGQSTYTSPYADLAMGAEKIVQNLSHSASALAGALGIDSLQAAAMQAGSTKLRNQSSTISLWEQSGKPPLPITMTMLNYDASKDVINDAWDLYSMIYPTTGGDKSTSGLFEAPGGYKASSFSSGEAQPVIQGTWSLFIGSWFKAFDLVLTGVDLTHSAAQVADDNSVIPKPLYVTISATLESAYEVTQENVKSWYVGGGA